MATVLSHRPGISDRTMMHADRIAVYSGAFIEGTILVVFAAYTGIFVSRSHYGLTLPAYGLLFIPQVVAIVLAALFSLVVCCRIRARPTYLAGLSCSLLGLALLFATEWVPRLAFSYPLLLASTAFVGLGGGLSYPFLRCYAVAMRPLRARRQILLINGLLAAGMAIAPAYALLTAVTGIWWTLPLLLGFLLIAEMVLSRSVRTPPEGAPVRRVWPLRPGLRAYPALALLYGVCAVICITAPHHVTGSGSHIHLSLLVLAEVAFWAALVQGSRVVFAIIDGMRSGQRAASIAFFMIAICILLISHISRRYDIMHVGLYLLAAIGCAALLPIDARPGHEGIALVPLAVTGGIITLFPIGLGLSRYGYNIVSRSGITPLEVFLGVALVGAIACMLLLPVIRSWRTLEYFEQPAGRDRDAGRLGYTCIAAMRSAPAEATAPAEPSAPAEASAPAEPGVPSPRDPGIQGDGSRPSLLHRHGPHRG
jgi:MFS family permease